jgi:hypothetical protein
VASSVEEISLTKNTELQVNLPDSEAFMDEYSEIIARYFRRLAED